MFRRSSGPSAEQIAAAVEALRQQLQGLELPGRYPGSKADDHDLQRFLSARDYDVAKAEAMARQHAEWRDKTFPIRRDPTIDLLLSSKRVGEVVCWNRAGEPLIVFDCAWGTMLNGVTAEEFLRAYLIFMDSVLSEMQERGSLRWCWLSIGGPPPLDLARQLSSIFEGNYPELLRLAVIAPIPPIAKRIVDGMLWFLPQKTRDKFKLASTSAEVCQMLECEVAQLPELYRDLEEFEKGRRKDGIVMSATTEDGNLQHLRHTDVAAGKKAEYVLEVDDQVASVTITLGVAPTSYIPRFIAGEQDIKFAVKFVPAKDGQVQTFLEPTVVVASKPYEQIWENPDGLSGKLCFELDNTHSKAFAKALHLGQLVRRREAPAAG